MKLLRPTARDAHWWWRVHNAAPDLSLLKKRAIGSAFASRELKMEILGWPLELEDLEAFLAYKPWLGEENQFIYRNAIELGHIPPLYGMWSRSSLEPSKEELGMWPPDFPDADIREKLFELEKEAQQ